MSEYLDTFVIFLRSWGYWATTISIACNIAIAVSAVVPTFVITAANLLVFGFWGGVLVSLIGECIGAGVAFWVYRAGFRRRARTTLRRYPRALKLVKATGSQAFSIILLLRVLPFIPSFIATLGAAVGKVSFLLFFLASSLGKAPALLIEAYSIYEIGRFEWQGKVLLMLIAATVMWDMWRRKRITKRTQLRG